MCRMLVLLTLPWLVLGCATASDGRSQAARCAENWKAKGFEFDPATMTCEQMFERAQATWKAEYWGKQGYTFDPATMTAEEMDRRAGAQQEAARLQASERATVQLLPAEAPASSTAVVKQAPPETGRISAGPNVAGTGPAEPPAVAAKNGSVVANNGGGSSSGTTAASTDRPIDPEVRRMLKGMTIVDVRLQYPQYNDMKDAELARRIHEKYFSDTPFEDFARRFLRYPR